MVLRVLKAETRKHCVQFWAPLEPHLLRSDSGSNVKSRFANATATTELVGRIKSKGIIFQTGGPRVRERKPSYEQSNYFIRFHSNRIYFDLLRLFTIVRRIVLQLEVVLELSIVLYLREAYNAVILCS